MTKSFRPEPMTNPNCPHRSACLRELWPDSADYGSIRQAKPLNCTACPYIFDTMPLTDPEIVGMAKLMLAVFAPELWRYAVKCDSVDVWIREWMKVVVHGNAGYTSNWALVHKAQISAL